MKHKNAWNKEFKTETVKDSKGKKQKIAILIRNGAKSSKLENHFANAVKKMQPDKSYFKKKAGKDDK